MSDYSNSYNGAAKDTTNDIILGADLDTQFDSVATMSATKSNKVSGATANNIAKLDSNGDLVDSGVPAETFPVGFIWTSTSSTNPNSILGYGTWTQIASGRTLIGEGSGVGLIPRTAGATGGQEDSIIPAHTHTGTTDSDGSHTHTIDSAEENSSTGSTNSGNSRASTPSTVTTNSSGSHTHTFTTDSTGESVTDKNMQPYLVVYFFERTA